VFKAGLAEMHLAVDDAGQNVKALAIQSPGGGELAKVAQTRNAALMDGQIADANAVMVDEGSTLQNEISHAFH
jgi:hypothetical protein